MEELPWYEEPLPLELPRTLQAPADGSPLKFEAEAGRINSDGYPYGYYCIDGEITFEGGEPIGIFKIFPSSRRRIFWLFRVWTTRDGYVVALEDNRQHLYRVPPPGNELPGPVAAPVWWCSTPKLLYVDFEWACNEASRRSRHEHGYLILGTKYGSPPWDPKCMEDISWALTEGPVLELCGDCMRRAAAQ